MIQCLNPSLIAYSLPAKQLLDGTLHQLMERVCWVDVNKLQVAINDARKSKVVDERLEEASSLLEKVKGYLEERRNSRFFQANNNDNGNNIE